MTNFEFMTNQITEDDISEVSSPYVIPVLEETSFLVPTRLIINRVNVFQYKNQKGQLVEWIDLPAFGMLRDWTEASKVLQEHGNIVLKLADYGELTISVSNQLVTVVTNFGLHTGSDSYADFLEGISSSLEILSSALFLHYPKIVSQFSMGK